MGLRMEDDAWQMRAPYYSLVEPLLLLSLKVVQMERLFSFFFFYAITGKISTGIVQYINRNIYPARS